jgi:putative ABC transport system permease protein
MGLWQDLRYAIRLLVKDKWFTVVAAAALALGIGVNNTVFTLVNAVLIRGLPFDEPERIMALGTRDRVHDRQMGVSYLDFKDWTAASHSFSGLAVYTGNTFNVSDEGRPPERYLGPYISFNAFKLIGQQPVIGRDFLAEDDRPGAPAVVILGSGIWKDRYGGDPAILGRTIRVNDVPSTVIGVMPEGFKFPFSADLWQPLSLLPGLADQKRNSRSLEVFGRLAPGVSRTEAAAELAAVGARLARDYPDTNKDIVPTVETFNERFNGGPIKLIFLSLMGAVGFVLLIACANVANLLLARAAHRAREISVRVSLGATRWRIVRQLLIETVLLALVSGVLGFAVSVVGIRWFDAVTQDFRPYWIQFRMDASVFAFLAAVCLGTGIVFGLAPALHVSKTDVNEVLKEGGRSGASGVRARRWTAALIVSEIALTLVLLAGAGFMIRSFLSLYRLDLGMDTSRLLVARLALPDRKYPTVAARLAFYQTLEDRLRANERIRSAAIASNLPLQGGLSRLLTIEGRPVPAGEQTPTVTYLTVDSRYFETLGVQLARGRAFLDTDGMPGHESAIINQQFAQMHFPGEDPIGRRITLSVDPNGDGPPGSADAPATQTATIVGIAPNVRQRNFQERDPDPVAYLPFRSYPGVFVYMLARSDGEPAALTALIREEVRAIDANLPLFRVQTMDQNLAQQRWPFRVFGTMFAMFAGIALVLAAVGLYAITAYSVAQRTQEIGVRMALGARPAQVRWLVLRQGLVQTAVGLVLGLAGAIGVGRLLQSVLVQIGSRDAATLTSIVVLLAVVAIAACLAPARRATRLDPLVALRYE